MARVRNPAKRPKSRAAVVHLATGVPRRAKWASAKIDATATATAAFRKGASTRSRHARANRSRRARRSGSERGTRKVYRIDRPLSCRPMGGPARCGGVAGEADLGAPVVCSRTTLAKSEATQLAKRWCRASTALDGGLRVGYL